ncbi:4597_t:CDS:10 [Cetraspora pellucida]|uniref:Elongation factor-like 1 n=2 Tax=Gigasporaceae TaxID=36753 RepID=A0A9N9GP81_9GLOM|nr:4597_t:CDS:10 [Cetraspora pellucida]
MPVVTTAQLVKLQSRTENIRNICILAHVDHGKTTLSDSLLASNGIISSKLAGKVRYLDSREDEQERGITMEASGISLYFQILRKAMEGEETITNSDEYLINLIDAPGHVDFSSEVSTASRLCDGALILVDAVEGVCTQAQVHLNKIIEQVNAIVGTYFAGDVMEEETKRHEAEKEKLLHQEKEYESTSSNEEIFEEHDDSNIYFTPESGNVIFASALDGWAFRIEQFAQIYAAKLGIKESILRKVLWGDYYLDPKTKRFLKHKHLKGRQLKPMFVQFVLENIWTVYDSVIINNNREKIEKIVKSLQLKILPRDMRSKDTRTLLTSIFNQWLPLSTALPSPIVAQPMRLPRMLSIDIKKKPINEVEHGLFSCDVSDSAPVVAYVSKMFAVHSDMLPENRRKQLSAEELREKGRLQRIARLHSSNIRTGEVTVLDTTASDSDHSEIPISESLDASLEQLHIQSTIDSEDTMVPEQKPTGETFIGFSRLYSGTIRVGQKLYVLGPKYDPAFPDRHCSEITVKSLYLMMGRELESLQEVPAGNVFGIGGLEGHILKNGTLCSTKDCKNLAGVTLESAPIVRVALEPTDPSEIDKLIEGLRLLNQADPCVEVLVQETGEHVILTAGEVHLERCLRDLKERFAKIEIQVSPPIVPFRETIVPVSELQSNKDNTQRGVVTLSTPNKYCTIKVRSVPLPSNVTAFLNQHAVTIKSILERQQRSKIDSHTTEEYEDAIKEVAIKGENILDAEDFSRLLQHEFDKAAGSEIWKNVVKKWQKYFSDTKMSGSLSSDINEVNLEFIEERKSLELSIRDFEEGIHTGFQLATKAGPLCAEPLMGVAYFLEDFTISIDENVDISEVRPKLGGYVITTMRDACLQGFLDLSPRLMLAMYSCDIQATTEALGRVYAVISRRRGRIISDELKEGTPFFQIIALLPVVESFGFADEIRKRTSGAAIPQLIFSGFEMLDEDPFWVPTTEEELEDLGEKSDRENLAKKYMENVRKRKGMFTDKKIVEHAEKQRTLKKK